jgi:hypothetical protein
MLQSACSSRHRKEACQGKNWQDLVTVVPTGDREAILSPLPLAWETEQIVTIYYKGIIIFEFLFVSGAILRALNTFFLFISLDHFAG